MLQTFRVDDTSRTIFMRRVIPGCPSLKRLHGPDSHEARRAVHISNRELSSRIRSSFKTLRSIIGRLGWNLTLLSKGLRLDTQNETS